MCTKEMSTATNQRTLPTGLPKANPIFSIFRIGWPETRNSHFFFYQSIGQLDMRKWSTWNKKSGKIPEFKNY